MSGNSSFLIERKCNIIEHFQQPLKALYNLMNISIVTQEKCVYFSVISVITAQNMKERERWKRARKARFIGFESAIWHINNIRHNKVNRSRIEIKLQ